MPVRVKQFEYECTGDAQIARETHLQTTAEGRAVDRGEGRHWQRLQLPKRAAQIEEELVNLVLRHG